jgi:hypothetical protein
MKSKNIFSVRILNIVLFLLLIVCVKASNVNYHINISIKSEANISFIYWGSDESSISNEIKLDNNLCTFIYSSKNFGILYLDIENTVYEIHLTDKKKYVNLDFDINDRLAVPPYHIGYDTLYNSLLNAHFKYVDQNFENFEEYIKVLSENFQENPYFTSLVCYKLRFVLDEYDDNETLQNLYNKIKNQALPNDKYYYPQNILTYFENGFKWEIDFKEYLRSVFTKDSLYLSDLNMENSYLIFKTNWCIFCAPKINQLINSSETSVTLVLIDIETSSDIKPIFNNPMNRIIDNLYPQSKEIAVKLTEYFRIDAVPKVFRVIKNKIVDIESASTPY